MSFKLFRSSGASDIPRTCQMDVSLTLSIGDPVKISAAGKLQLANTTDKAIGISNQAYTSGATEIKKLSYTPSLKGIVEFETALTLAAALSAQPVVASTTTSVTFALTAGTLNDMVGGEILSIATGEKRQITGNTYSGGNVVISFVEPLNVALTTSQTVSVLPCGPGDTAVQFAGSSGSMSINTTIAGKTTGNVTIIEVDDKLQKARCTYNP